MSNLENDHVSDALEKTLKSPVKRNLTVVLFIANLLGIMFLIKRFGG